MPLTALDFEYRLIDKLAPGNPVKFLRLLNEADERLLESGKWSWTRTPIELTPESYVEATQTLYRILLPANYVSIVGARIGGAATGVRWQEITFLEDGPSLINIEGCGAELVDQGEVDVDGTLMRSYRVFGDDVTLVTVLARYKPVLMVSMQETPRCQSFTALKQAMYAIVYEEANDVERSVGYMQLAIRTLNQQEEAYRGSARKVFKTGFTMPVRRRGRTSFP